MRRIFILWAILILAAGYRGAAQHPLSADSLARLPAYDRLLALNVFVMERGEDEAQKTEVIRRLYPLADSLRDTQLRGYLDFYRYIFPALSWKDPDMCIDLLTRASDHYKAQGKKLFAGICLHMIGQHHYMREEFARAFENLLQANDLFREVGYANIPEIGRYLHELALAHYYFRDYQKVMDLMRASVNLRPYDKNLDMQRYNNLGLAHRNSGNPDSALYYFEHTLRLAGQYRDSIWISIANGNIGSVYHNMGLYDKALKHREADHAFRVGVTSIPGFTKMSTLGLAETWLKLGNLQKTKHYLAGYGESGEKVSHNYSGTQYEKTIRKAYFRVAHQYYSAIGDHQTAYRCLSSLQAAAAEEDVVYHRLITTTAQQRIDIQRQRSSVEMLRQEQQHQKARYMLMVAALTLLIVVFALLYYLTRFRKDKERAEHLARQKTLQLEKLTIREELSKARRNLRDHLDRIREKEHLIEKLTADLDALRRKEASLPSDNGVISEVEETLRNARILTNQHWEDFQQRFEELYKDFSQRLREIRPRLTQAETRFFMLNAVGLSEQEMAHALGVLPATIRMIRHRIKKKYGKPAEELVPVLREYPTTTAS